MSNDISPKMSSASAKSDWQTVDFPNSISADATQRQALYIQATMQSNSSDSPAPASNTMDQLNQAELIKLIQELNQCNHELMSRVTQLEASLEQSERALDAEIARSHDIQAALPPDAETNATPEQVHYLLNQLEFAQQTIQRQEILTETLTHQLQTSQARVAQIERDCALTQQRYHEQSHQLQHVEHLCHDLQSRLQRQQGYTLQFKTALEKCLEVPPPSYEAATSVSGTLDDGAAIAPEPPSPWTNLEEPLAQPFLPKVRHIRPWSGQSSLPSEAEAAVEESPCPSEFSGAATPSDQLLIGGEPPTADLSMPPLTPVELSPAQSRFQTTLSELARTTLDAATELPAEAIAPVEVINPSDSETAMASLAAESTSEAPGLTSKSTPESRADRTPVFSAAATPAIHPDVEATAADNALEPTSQSSVTNPEAIASTSPDQQESSGGDALWRDLAKLVDASMEDVIRVQTAQNFESFEGLQLPPAHGSGRDRADLTPEDEAMAGSLAYVDASRQPQSERQQTHPEVEARRLEAESSDPEMTPTFTWPSPLIYPTRPPKKRASLAAVDLPTFPRPAG